MDRVIAFLPAYNEEASIGRIVAEVLAAGFAHQVLVVDDGSRDGTAFAAREAGADVLQHAVNLGIGGAVQSAYRYARERCYTQAVRLDADGQHDPGDAPALLAALRAGADFAVGSRFLGQADGDRSTPARRVGAGLLSGALRALAGVRATDPTSGFCAAGSRAVALFADDLPSDFPEVEGRLRLARAGLEAVEVPVKMRRRSAGASSLAGAVGPYYMARVLTAVLVGTAPAARIFRA